MTGKEYNEQFSEEELSSEIWKDIPNYEGYYQVSNLGRVKSLNRVVCHRKSGKLRLTGRILVPICNNKTKRFMAQLSKKGKERLILIHRLVLFAFIGPCPEGMECCHNDDIGSNNRLENLRWDTPKANQADRTKNGNGNEGEKNGMSKHTKKEVEEIRKLYATGQYTQVELGKKFTYTYQFISAIINNKVWKN